jgi:hypothetical protein
MGPRSRPAWKSSPPGTSRGSAGPWPDRLGGKGITPPLWAGFSLCLCSQTRCQAVQGQPVLVPPATLPGDGQMGPARHRQPAPRSPSPHPHHGPQEHSEEVCHALGQLDLQYSHSPSDTSSVMGSRTTRPPRSLGSPSATSRPGRHLPGTWCHTTGRRCDLPCTG